MEAVDITKSGKEINPSTINTVFECICLAYINDFRANGESKFIKTSWYLQMILSSQDDTRWLGWAVRIPWRFVKWSANGTEAAAEEGKLYKLQLTWSNATLTIFPAVNASQTCQHKMTMASPAATSFMLRRFTVQSRQNFGCSFCLQVFTCANTTWWRFIRWDRWSYEWYYCQVENKN